MPEPKDIKPIRVERELHACPSCGYQLGFHISFLHVAAGTSSTSLKSTRDVYRTILICPECGARYDVGWKVSLYE
mgnify:FL=1